MDYNQYYNPYLNMGNPYLNRQMQQNTQYQGQWGNPIQPQTDIVKVNGRGGAEAYQMGVNSKALLLDEKDPIVWLVTTDGAGYKTVTAYDVTPHTEEPKVNIEAETLQSLENRVDKLERMLNEYGKSNIRNDESDKSASYRNTRK